MQNPYRARHSVWIDVFGIVLFGVLLIGGAGYLLTRLGGATTGVGGSGGQGTALSASRSAPPSPSLPGEFSSQADGAGLLGNPADPAGRQTDVPFSESWREQAAPDLTGPSPSAGGAEAIAGEGGGGEGPAIASARSVRSSGGSGGRRAASNRAAGGEWRAEARRFSGRVRALSTALGRINREAAATSGEAASSTSSRAGETSGGEASTAAAPGPPKEPDPVPIGDHLHWLVVAGVLWGVWRIGRGA